MNVIIDIDITCSGTRPSLGWCEISAIGDKVGGGSGAHLYEQQKDQIQN